MVAAIETVSEVAVHMSVSFTIMYVATGSLTFGGLAAFLEPVCTVTLMPFHKRFWEKMRARLERKETRHAGQVPEAVRA